MSRSETTRDQWLARGVCSQGHAIYGDADLYWSARRGFECARCRREMLDEGSAIRRGADERTTRGRE